jgi:DNA invertase Pin-like site-specific DNA recombinase
MSSNTYGYVRVSTREQNEDRQLIALKDYKVLESNIYVDKLSGRDFNRPQYQKLMKKIRPGDLIVVKSIDRLGRNYEEIQVQWRKITKEKQVDMVVLDMPLLDTRRSGNDLTGTFVADMVLQILSYVAQTERENIHQRQREGIEAAKLRGVKFGRPRKPVPEEFWRIREEWINKKISSREAARELSIAQDTFLRWVHGK